MVVIAIVVLMMSSTFVFLPAGASRNFPDVNQVHPYFQAIETLALEGAVDGYPDGYFRPDDPVSRVEALKIAMLTARKNVRNLDGNVDFPDVPRGIWYGPFLERAQQDNIIKGFEDGFFYPDQKITYMEALKIVMKLNNILVDYEPEGDLWFLPYLKVADDFNIMDLLMARRSEVLARQDRIRASWISRGEMAYLAYEVWSQREVLSVKARNLKRALAYKPYNKYSEVKIRTRNEDPNYPRATQIIGKYERAQRIAKKNYDAVITQRGIELAKMAYQLAAYKPQVMEYWPFLFQETGLSLEEWYMMKISEILRKKKF